MEFHANNSSRIAIVCVAYNRSDSLKRLLDSLSSALYDDEVDLIISIDKSENDSVRKLADDFNWKYGTKILVNHPVKLGLKNHILGIGLYLETYESIIVLEDDISVSPSFYLFAKSAVKKYSGCKDIAGISLYSYTVNYQNSLPFVPQNNGYDAYLMQVAMSWGQVWMRDSWNSFYDWYKQNPFFTDSDKLPVCLLQWGEKSWLRFHMKYCIENNKYFVYPYVSFTSNNGDSGEHFTLASSLFSVGLMSGIKREYSLPDFQNAVKYDGFFESMNMEAVYEKLNLQGVCMNIYGEKRSFSDSNYMVSCLELDYPVCFSSPLVYRPIEMNMMVSGSRGPLRIYRLEKGNPCLKRKHFPIDFYLFLFNMERISLLRIIRERSFYSFLSKIVRKKISTFFN